MLVLVVLLMVLMVLMMVLMVVWGMAVVWMLVKASAVVCLNYCCGDSSCDLGG
jgi:flagellar basal body-associated protein FliL